MGWTRQRLSILAAVIFVAHVIAIFALHTPQPMVVLPEGNRTPRLLPVTSATNNAIELDGLNDPLVFAGAHQHGFSAAAWMMRPRQEFALSNSPPPPRFLAFSRQPTQFPPSDNAQSLSTHTQLPQIQFALSQTPSKSILMVQGALENRPLLKSLEAPIQVATDVLSNTVVQVGVRADGFPFSARIISGSGSRGADVTALAIANKARFAPLPPSTTRVRDELQWGELVFQWFTTTPTATNGLPKTASSEAR